MRIFMLILIIFSTLPQTLLKCANITISTFIGNFYPVTFYMMGLYIDEYKPKINKILAVFILLVFPLINHYLEYKFSTTQNFDYIMGEYNNIIVTFLVAVIVIVISSLEYKNKHLNLIFQFLSRFSFATYVLGIFISDRISRKLFSINGSFLLKLVATPVNAIISMGISIILSLPLIVLMDKIALKFKQKYQSP